MNTNCLGNNEIAIKFIYLNMAYNLLFSIHLPHFHPFRDTKIINISKSMALCNGYMYVITRSVHCGSRILTAIICRVRLLHGPLINNTRKDCLLNQPQPCLLLLETLRSLHIWDFREYIFPLLLTLKTVPATSTEQRLLLPPEF